MALSESGYLGQSLVRAPRHLAQIPAGKDMGSQAPLCAWETECHGASAPAPGPPVGDMKEETRASVLPELLLCWVQDTHLDSPLGPSAHQESGASGRGWAWWNAAEHSIPSKCSMSAASCSLACTGWVRGDSWGQGAGFSCTLSPLCLLLVCCPVLTPAVQARSGAFCVELSAQTS